MKIDCILFAAVCASAHGAVIQTVTTSAAMNGIAVSNSDLLQQAGVVTTTVGYSAFATFGQPDPVLRDGSAGGNTTGTGDWPNLVMEVSAQSPQFTITFDLDLTGAPLGYDLTNIDSFSGWSDNRASHLHNIYYSVVGSAAYTQVLSGLGGAFGDSFGSAQSSGGLKVGVTDSTGVIASGVDSIRFEMFPGAAGGHVYREIDVIGIATVPEPSAAVLGGLGMLALLRRRRS